MKQKAKRFCNHCDFYWFFKIVVTMLLALSLGAVSLVDAKPPSFSPGNGKVTCATIKAQILAQAPIGVTDPKSYTQNVRSLAVCNRLITYHT